MTIHYNVSGEARKHLVYTMAELLECKPRYLQAPTYAYQVGDYHVSRGGEVSFDDRTADSEEVEMLIESLAERGFKPEAADEGKREAEPRPMTAEAQEVEQDEGATDLVVSMPYDGFDADSLGRLHALIASKRTLLQKALGVDALPVEVSEDRVSFPWFKGETDAEHAQAYISLITQLCAMAKNSKRITAKEKETDNDKYAFRCFLLRLGFIGDKFKSARKILLEKLDGSSAFRNGPPSPVGAQDATTGAEREVQE